MTSKFHPVPEALPQGAPDSTSGQVLALSGGIGGTKLALGLSRVLPPDGLTIVGNTGDDFEHLGLAISPDLDTLLYTLAGLSDSSRGWGRKDETWTFMKALVALGGETWFQLGDGDLATHIERSRRLSAGETLTAIMDDFRRQLGIAARLLPMTNDRVRTSLITGEGWIDFQHYFVRLACEPAVRQIAFAGAETARPQPDFMAALRDPGLRAVVICPSNPLISVEPILAVPGIREALRACTAPVVAVSPLVGGRAIKGPAAKMMTELGHEPGSSEVARRYADFLDGFMFDETDPAPDTVPHIQTMSAQTVMTTLEDREALARTVLAFADRLRSHKRANRETRAVN
jgi:LPPG:FO 2-phospho-L-lactate transferase